MSLKVLLGFREPGLSEELTAAAMVAAYIPKERVTADLAAEIGKSFFFFFSQGLITRVA